MRPFVLILSLMIIPALQAYEVKRKGPENLNFQALVSSGFYPVRMVKDRVSSGLQLSYGIMANLCPGKHLKIHILYFHTYDKFSIPPNRPNITGPANITLNIGDFGLGAGYTIYPVKSNTRFCMEVFGGIMSTYVYTNKRYFNTSYTVKNPFNGKRDSTAENSTYLGLSLSFRIRKQWSLKVNGMHRFIPFHIVEGYKSPLLNFQLGICYGVM